MDDFSGIEQYDVVEITRVPEEYRGTIELGDVGVIVEEYYDDTFLIECVEPGGSCKWLVTLTIRDIRLKSKDPFRTWVRRSLPDNSITKPSLGLGCVIGAVFGILTGGGLGAITKTFNGILTGLVIGLLLGIVTGALTAALTVKTAGTTGGIGVGYFTGMLFGGVFGLLLGMLIPTSWRMSAHTEGLPVLDALVTGRFEAAMLIGFPLSILAAIVGVWIGGKNFIPRNLKERYRS